MNPELQKALGDILALLTASADQVGNVAQHELPLLVREYLLWGIFDAVLWLAMSVAIGVALIRFGRRVLAFEDYEDEGAALFFGRYVFPLAGWAFVIIGTISNLYQILQVLYAPRVYLLESVIQVVK